MKDDPTKQYEDIAAEVLKDADYGIHVLGPAIQNRPMFSTPKPKEVEHQEFAEARNQAMMGDPTLLVERLQNFEAVFGFEGRIEFLNWLTKHHAMITEKDNARSKY